MSDTSAPKFSEREMQMLSWAMQSLKAPPEIDYEKLAGFAGMTNHRSASNAWANIKKKLFVGAPTDGSATPPKPKSTPKKKTSAPTSDGDGATNGADETPKKTPRKRAAPKKADDESDGESPKKRGRKPKKDTAATDNSKPNGVKNEEVSSPKDTAVPELKTEDEGEDVVV